MTVQRNSEEQQTNVNDNASNGNGEANTSNANAETGNDNASIFNTNRDNLHDEELPTYTIIENVPEKRTTKARTACGGCLPERTAVLTVLAVYFFLGVLYTANATVVVMFVPSTRDRILYAVSFVLSLALLVSSLLGMNATYKENARALVRLSIVFWVLTALTLAFSASIFVVTILNRDELVASCQKSDQEDGIPPGESDCEREVNSAILRDGINLFCLETLQLYFAYVIFRYARYLSRQRVNDVPARSDYVVNAPTTTYAIYAARVPTATDWVPPPMYDGNPNNVPLAGDRKETANAV